MQLILCVCVRVCVCTHNHVSAIILTLPFLLSLVIPLILMSRKAEQSSEKSDRESGNGDSLDILTSSSRLDLLLKLKHRFHISVSPVTDSSGSCGTHVF